MRELGRRANRAPLAALMVDYGHVESGFGDTLQAVRGHRFADVLANPGAADLSSHVDFADLKREAVAAGLMTHGPMPQGEFLLKLGLAGRRERLLQRATPTQAEAIASGAARLVDPRQMGVLFRRSRLQAPGFHRRHPSVISISPILNRPAMVTPDRAMFCASTLESCDGIRHGFFTRRGGVSKGIYGSLNCGLGSRDDAEAVRQNRTLVAETLGVPPDRLLTLYQIHSAAAVVVDKPWENGAAEADALVTSTPGLAIGALTADCAPVLFCDAQARVIAAAHAGWRGALSGIVEATLATMEELGAERERTVAVIGPSISQRAYEVGADYMERFLAEEPGSEVFFVTDDSSGEPHFDLAGYVAERLSRAGVGTVSDLGLCTYCDETRLFSYRRSQHHGEEDYGRQISAIVLT